MKLKSKFFIFIVSCFMLTLVFNAKVSGQGEELINLAIDKHYTIDTPYPVDSHFGPIENVWADNNGLLTDGEYGGTQFDNGRFTGGIWQSSRIIILDLEKLSTVQKITLNTLQDLPVGINFPKEVIYSLSKNGKAWEELGRVENNIATTKNGPITQKYSIENVNKVARYVKAEIPVSSWLFIDELEVLGTNGKTGNHIIPSPKGPKDEKGYPRPGSKQVGGIEDQVLIYSGEWQHEPADWISFTKEDFQPYVTYVDEKMNSVDYMFDSFLFLPYAPQLDGTNFDPETGNPTDKDHWEDYIDRLFSDGYELTALDEAVREAKGVLPNKNYQAKVVISIPIPRFDQSDFGDILGTGESLNLNVSEIGEMQALENNKKVVQWFIDSIYERWEEADFEYIELTGFYWNTEYVTHQLRELDDKLIQWTGNYVRSKDAVFQWIPYYFSRGWEDWRELGFDSAVMQPNYFFHGNATKNRLDSISQAAYENGMGIEIELNDTVLTNEKQRQRYYDYLDKGKEHGIMNQSYSVFYQQVKTLLQAAESDNPDAREVYDETYNYIKGRY